MNTNSKKLDYILKEYDLKNNGTGILFVTQISDRTGNNWRYKDFLNNSWLYGSTLNELENHVKDSKLKWQIINVFSQKNSLFKDKEFKQKLDNEINTQKKDTRTGIFRVFLNDCWEYCYSNNSDDNFIIKKRTLSQLKNEVLKLHLPWIILDEELYKKSEIKDKELSEKYAHEQVLKKQKESEEKINKNKILKQISNEEINPRKINLDKMFR